MNASEFKAKCLSLLDEVFRTGESITILKRGKPVAQVGPFVGGDRADPRTGLEGTVHIHGDIVSPVLPPEAWDAVRGE